MKEKIVFILLFFCLIEAKAQGRIKDYNNIGWYSYFGDHTITKKLGLHTEFQWRRTHFITTWQQLLARAGVNYKVTDRFTVTVGYTFVETYPYGDYPSEKTAYPENRIYEDFKLKTPVGRFDIDNRIRVEQRFVAKLAENEGHKIETWNYKNRIRYQLKLDFALKGNTIDAKEVYITGYDEILINFGQGTTKRTVFDQNRFFVGLGYKVSKPLKFEAGYFFQLSKHDKEEKGTDQYVFEYNKGFIVSLYYDLNFNKKE